PPRPAKPSREQLLEPRRVVERPDHCEVRAPSSDHVARDPLNVLYGDLLELCEHFLGVRRPALQYLAAQPEHDQALRRLELEDEPSFREALRLLQLVLWHGV